MRYLLFDLFFFGLLNIILVSRREDRKIHFWRFGLLVVWLVNGGVMLALNGAYLLAVLHHSPYLIFIQALIALFKFGWNQLTALLVSNSTSTDHHFINMILLSLQVFNFVIAPCVATAVSDSNCFYELFNQQPAQAGTSRAHCFYGGYTSSTGFYCLSSTGLNSLAQPLYPAFVYHYQCSLALIVNYVPVLLYTFVFSSIVSPGLLLLCLRYPSLILCCCPRWTVREAFPRLFLMLDDQDDDSINHASHNDSEHHLQAGSDFDSVSSNANRNADLVRMSRSEKKPLFRGRLFMNKLMLHVLVLMTFGLAAPYLAFIVVCSFFAELSVMWMLIGRYLFIIMSAFSFKNSSVPISIGGGGREDGGGGGHLTADRSSDELSQGPGIELSSTLSNALEGNGMLEFAVPRSPPGPSRSAQGAKGAPNHQIEASPVYPVLPLPTDSAALLAAAQREVEEALEGVWAYPYDGMWLVVLVAQLFWALLFFDMVGDVYGFEAGLKAMVATMLCLPLLTYWLARIILASKPTLGSCMRSEQRVTSKTDLGLPGFQEPHVRAEVMNIIGAEQVRYFSKNSMEFIVFFSIRR